MTSDRLSKIEARWRRTSAGKWQFGAAGREGVVSFDGDDIVFVCDVPNPRNRDFIEQAHSDIPDLLETIRRERALTKALAEALRRQRIWLEYWKNQTISQQSKDERGHVTNSWAACPIPDWDVKQHIQAIIEELAGYEARTEQPATVRNGVESAKEESGASAPLLEETK